MRIIAGKYKGFKLDTLSGNTTRPTTDFIKEAMFSIISDFEDLKVLDLFSGSGALGLEALSRGALSVDLVDASQKAVQIIVQNVEKLKCRSQVQIYKKKVSVYLKSCSQKYDLIFLDPPYKKNLINETLKQILSSDLLADGGQIMLEHSCEEKIADQWQQLVINEKKYHEIVLTLLQVENNNENL